MGHQKFDKIMKFGFAKTSMATPCNPAGTFIVGIKSEFGQKQEVWKKNESFSETFTFWIFRASNVCWMDHKKIERFNQMQYCVFDWVFVWRNKLCGYVEN